MSQISGEYTLTYSADFGNISHKYNKMSCIVCTDDFLSSRRKNLFQLAVFH